MMIIPIRWSFSRENFLPILEAKCENVEINFEPLIIETAVDIIDSASKFKGSPFSSLPNLQNTYPITVSFSLIFPSDDDLHNFLENYRNNN